MTIHLLSADHRAQGLAAVSRLGGVSARLGPDLLRAVRGLDGALVLGTCNRLAILLDAPDDLPAETLRDDVTAFLAERSGSDRPVHLSLWSGRAAHYELFATAAGLESMVVGEREIAGQLRRALILATAEGTVTGALTRVVEHASAASRHVAARTALAGAGRSVVAVGLEIAARHLPPQGVRALIVGTGAYAGATVTALRNRGIHDIEVHSRSDRARDFAAGHCVRAVDGAGLRRSLALADLVVTCRGLGAPVLTRELVSSAVRPAAHRGAGSVAAGGSPGLGHRLEPGGGAAADGGPLVVLDLALSRDVERSVGALPGVLLIDLPSVQRAVPDVEAGQVEAARRIIAREVASFERMRAGRRMDPVVRRLRGGVEAVVEEEVARLHVADGRVDAEEAARALHHLAARLLHHPTVAARAAGEDGREREYLEALEVVLGPRIASGLRADGGPPAACPAHEGAREARDPGVERGAADLPTIPTRRGRASAADAADQEGRTSTGVFEGPVADSPAPAPDPLPGALAERFAAPDGPERPARIPAFSGGRS